MNHPQARNSGDFGTIKGYKRDAGAVLEAPASVAPKRRRLEMHDQSTPEIPYGYCRCGCGQKTTISPQTVRRNGYVKGEPRKFVNGHNLRLGPSPITIHGDIAQVHLFGGESSDMVAIIDVADVPKVQGHRWSVARRGNMLYASTSTVSIQTAYMHRVIMGAGPNQMVDHVDRDGLNNRKGNLRYCNHAQNGANRPHRGDGSSPYRGVSWNEASQGWDARVGAHSHSRFVGRFDTQEEAAVAYHFAAIETYGDFYKPDELTRQLLERQS